MLMKDAHRCVERAMHHNCPVCFEVNKALIQCNTYVSKILKSFLILREVFFFFFSIQFLFDTMRDITVLPCGHTIHLECLKEMEQHYR